MEEVLKVLAPKHPPEGCQFFRQYQPLLRASDDKNFIARFIEPDNMDAIFDSVYHSNIFFQSNPHEGAKKITQVVKDKYKTKIISDFDDWIEEIEPTNNAYVIGGTEECAVNIDDKWGIVWKAGNKYPLNGEMITFNPKENKKNMDRRKWLVENSDVVITTTEYLANKFRQFNKNVVVIPNAIDFNAYTPKEKDSKKVRIGWMFSSSHLVDWLDVSDVLRRVVNENDNVELIIMANELPPLNGIDEKKVIHQKAVKLWNGYFDAFSNLKIDIGLCHIMDNEFNKCKSPLKWEEYSAVKTCTLAPKTLYGDYIEDGKTGLLYDGTQENKRDFVDKLNYLIKRKSLRTKLAENAYNDVKEKYNNEKIYKKYVDLFKDVAK